MDDFARTWKSIVLVYSLAIETEGYVRDRTELDRLV